jgi:hypothetical protein
VSSEFPRLARARARRRARRRFQARLLSAIAALGLVLALGRVAARAPAAPVTAPEHVSYGRIETVERETRVIRVSAGFLGLASVALTVTPETLIVVGDKEGGFGDIRQGERVLAAYEVRAGARQAKRVEVFPPARAEP